MCSLYSHRHVPGMHECINMTCTCQSRDGPSILVECNTVTMSGKPSSQRWQGGQTPRSGQRPPWRRRNPPKDPNHDESCPWQMFITLLRAERTAQKAWLADKEGTAWAAKCCGCRATHNLKWQCRDCLLLYCKACTVGKQMLGIDRSRCEECTDHSRSQADGDRPHARGEPWRKGPESIQQSDAACAKRAKRRQEQFAKPWQAVWNYTPWHMACANCNETSCMKWHCTHCHKGFCKVCTLTRHQLGSSAGAPALACLRCKDMMKCGLLTHGTYLSPDTMRSLMSLSNGPPVQEEQPVPKRARVPEVTPEAPTQDSQSGCLEATAYVDKDIIDNLERGFTAMGVMDDTIRNFLPNRPPSGDYGRGHLWKSHRSGGTPPSDQSMSRCGSDDSISSGHSRDQTDSRSPSTRRAKPWRHWRPAPGTLITGERVAPSSAPYLMGSNGTLVANYEIASSSAQAPSTPIPARDVRVSWPWLALRPTILPMVLKGSLLWATPGPTLFNAK